MFLGNSTWGIAPGGGLACESAAPTLTRCTFAGNSAASGGGLYCLDSNPTLTECVFSDNTAFCIGGGAGGLSAAPTFIQCTFSGNSAMGGGGLGWILQPSPTIAECLFLDNTAGDNGGGGIYCSGASPSIMNCTLVGNGAGTGGGIICYYESYPTIGNTIIAFSTQGEAVGCIEEASPTLVCCDLFGNAGGDWVGCIANQSGVDGNISGEPLFCGSSNPEAPYTLHADSPCAAYSPPNHECDLIGAYPVGCGAGAAAEELHRGSALDFTSCAPNPFRLTTQIAYSISAASVSSFVTLAVYDPAGRLVRTLVHAPHLMGIHRVSWNGADDARRPVEGGIYFARLSLNDETRTTRLILVR
ncbi:MAG: right-handed parallel beta-helix repeat-containing protein [Candidatus Eisenbacteria sp.]|nr:right-handed parallel beta-helix repeat-containing protein [Candidatus Eisenbacteria bacterium]